MNAWWRWGGEWDGGMVARPSYFLPVIYLPLPRNKNPSASPYSSLAASPLSVGPTVLFARVLFVVCLAEFDPRLSFMILLPPMVQLPYYFPTTP